MYIYIYIHIIVYIYIHMVVSINGGTPIAGWFTMEHPTKMDENRGCPYDLGTSMGVSLKSTTF